MHLPTAGRDCGMKTLVSALSVSNPLRFTFQKINLLIARCPCGTQRGLLPLLPSGPDGVCNLLLRRTRLSTRFYFITCAWTYMVEGFNEFQSIMFNEDLPLVFLEIPLPTFRIFHAPIPFIKDQFQGPS